LAVSVIRPNLLAVCFDALTREGKEAIMKLDDTSIIPVHLHEAKAALACNLVSTGETVIMVDGAPKLTRSLKEHGLNVVTLPNHELRKGGGGFRCISLSLYS
jgi:N-dimethylarginine dimethylaminohydrolase